MASRPESAMASKARIARSGLLCTTSGPASAWTTISETAWARMSCISRAIRARSSPTARAASLAARSPACRARSASTPASRRNSRTSEPKTKLPTDTTMLNSMPLKERVPITLPSTVTVSTTARCQSRPRSATV